MSQKITSYPLAIMLNTISTVAMVGGLIWLVYGYMKNLPEELQIVVFILSFAQWVFLKKPLSYMLQKAILDNEYDEFGVSKKKKVREPKPCGAGKDRFAESCSDGEPAAIKCNSENNTKGQS